MSLQLSSTSVASPRREATPRTETALGVATSTRRSTARMRQTRPREFALPSVHELPPRPVGNDLSATW